MKKQLSSIQNRKLLLSYTLGAALAWTLVLFGLGLFSNFDHLNHVRANVVEQAHDTSNKDLVFRRWVAGHGGVYVTPTAETPPNPHLSHLPHRDLTTSDGQPLTLINPAYMMRQVHELGFRQFGFRGHITSLKPLRPENRPDVWEESALKAFAGGADEVVEETLIEGHPFMRLMKPLFVEERCLKCHAVQGYQVGDLRGGISVSIAMGPSLARHRQHMDNLARMYLLLWLAGLLAIFFSFRHNRKRLEKSAESALQMRKLSSLFEQTHSAVAILSLDGIIEYVNHGYEVLSGYTIAEMVGRHPRDLFFTDENQAERRELWEAVSQGQSWRGVLVSRRKDGTLVYEDTAGFPLFDEQGKIINYVAIKHDVTQSQKLQEQLFQAQKMEAVGTLASGVAHDFNNLLTVINSFSEILIDECDKDSPIRSDLVEINKAGRRAADLTRQLLAFSRRQIIQPRDLCLRKLIENLMKMMRRLLSEDIELKFDLPEPEVAIQIKADPGQIEQILINLLVNARDALKQSESVEKGKKITLRLAEIVLDDDFVASHVGSLPGRQALVEVSDNGCGMSPEALGHCFEPFFTTKELGQGTGLGLSTVYGIIKQNGGYITIYSEPGQGTTIRIYWPLSHDDHDDTVAVEPDELKLSGKDLSRVKGATILLVEDDEKIRKIAGIRLQKAGFRVIDAVDGQDALNKLEVAGKAPNLLFTDMVMPRIGGLELSRRLRDNYPGLPVLYTSGYSDNSVIKELGKGEAFLQKPYTIKALLAVIDGLLNVQ
ncbi:MAG: DUF3365 domain-containing protein [Deltaproteobacteria bacterium]|nr:DUF3365 domain-containing protein [Deltaproteobacteria bacterium]